MSIKLSRRDFVKLAALAGVAASVPLVHRAIEKKVEEPVSLSPETSVRFVNTYCYMCAALCGVRIAVRDGKPIYVTRNEENPQPGICGRGALATWLWNHPLRIRKPLKRVGERGEGKFQEISWEQALDEIAAKLKEIAEKYGPKAIAFTWHEHGLDYVPLFRFALGTPSFTNHIGTCNNN
ncbi:MAG: molybdopterin-dependent oxidoreductase [Acidilobaceae archaeon]